MRLTVRAESFPVAGVFAISRGSRREARVLTVTLERDGITGRGECVPYARYGESMESVEAQILSAEAAIAGGCDRLGLLAELPAGAARNALDCALWDWHAKAAGRRVWELAGLPEPEPVVTAYTLSLDAPDAMRAKAAENAWRPLLKIKLGGGADLDRLRAVREGAPDARLIVDANEGWTPEAYLALLPALEAAGVALIEQPFPAGEDAALDSLPRPISVCADESCHDRASLAALKGRYDMVNIKLDKTGGLTEALALAEAARAAGFGIMVGCMLGSSLAMAPAHLLAQGADVVDLDAPLLLAADRDPPVRYAGARMHPPEAALWG
ncbi:MAG: dipeptide epimerase [Alphaproteobacteria bacterium]|nr:MAG: dipeptide epimerase [Alphaproteobacteria bacterium]